VKNNEQLRSSPLWLGKRKQKDFSQSFLKYIKTVFISPFQVSKRSKEAFGLPGKQDLQISLPATENYTPS